MAANGSSTVKNYKNVIEWKNNYFLILIFIQWTPLNKPIVNKPTQFALGRNFYITLPLPLTSDNKPLG